MNSKFRVATFLALHPHWYPELARRIRHNLALRMLPAPIGRSRRIAEEWAAERAVSMEAALEQLGAKTTQRLDKVFPDIIAEAHAKQEECPVVMGGGGSMDLLYNICELIEAKTAVETGVAYGFSSLAMLLSLSRRDGKLFSVDMPYPGRNNARFVGYVIPDRFRSFWELLRYPDYIGLKKALSRIDQIDICHYDSDKSYEGRAWGYRRLWDKLRQGGVFISDDIGDNTAFRDFVLELNLTPVVIRTPGGGSSGERYVGLLVKSPSASECSHLTSMS